MIVYLTCPVCRDPYPTVVVHCPQGDFPRLATCSNGCVLRDHEDGLINRAWDAVRREPA
jgi:hypothetical protein